MVMVATIVSVNAANKEMKAIASWSRIDFTDSNYPAAPASGEAVSYTYKWDTKGLIVCKITTYVTRDPAGVLPSVYTTTGVELTLYDSKCKEVGVGTLEDIDAITANCVYALQGVMNGKVAVISEIPRRTTGATSDKIKWYTYQINKDGKNLKDLCVQPLQATANDSPSTPSTYSTENLAFAFGIVIWRDITETWDAVKSTYTQTIKETQLYTKPDFKSCLIAGEAAVVAGEASPSVPKIMSLNNSTDTYAPITGIRTQEVDITIVK